MSLFCSSKLDGDLHLSPLIRGVRAVIGEKARFASGHPMFLRVKRGPEKINTFVEELVGEATFQAYGNDCGLRLVKDHNVSISAGGSELGLPVEEAHSPIHGVFSEEASGSVFVSEIELDGGSHGNVSALDVIEESPESSRCSEESLDKDLATVKLSAANSWVSFDLNCTLRGWGIVANRQGGFSSQVSRNP
jgi:hypothetical protein